MGLGRSPAGPQDGQDNQEESHTENNRQSTQKKRQTESRSGRGRSAQDRQRGTDREISRVRRGGVRTLHYGAGSGVVGPPEADSEGGSQEPQAPGTAWCRGRCPPHRAEAFVAIQYVDEEKKKANSISRPASNRQEVVQTGQTPRPLPKQPDIQTETNEGDPSEPLISTTKQATRPHTEANQPTKWGQGQARPTTRRPKTQKTQQTQKPQKTTTEATGKRKSHGIGPRESHQGNPYRGTKIEFAT